jgi:hypothetical protein
MFLEKCKSECTLDTETIIMLEFLKRLWSSKRDDGSYAGYLQKHQYIIQQVGKMLILFDLAESDDKAVLGWRPTMKLIKMIVKRATRWRDEIDAEPDIIDRATIDVLWEVLEWEENTGAGVCLLNSLGLVRETPEGLIPTRKLFSWMKKSEHSAFKFARRVY